MSKIIIIGIEGQSLANQRNLLKDCQLLVGGKRLLALAGDLAISTRGITPLAETLPAIREALKVGNVGVLASGDPLFFGIGKRLIEHFGADTVEIHPALSSLQTAMARFKIAWDDARLISLHGRSHHHPAGLLLNHPKTFVFTDKANSPGELARQILAYLELIKEEDLQKNCRFMVAENLGGSEEKIFSGTLNEAATRDFAELNVICISLPANDKGRLGLMENDIAHSRGLITKDEVRAITLHRLQLPATGVFWDIGAGSGSVAIEAARLNPALLIYAIEQKEEELANIRHNIRRFNCYNVVPVPGQAPGALKDLPSPDRVFIGGSGGRLSSIIETAGLRLSAQGRMVVNGVIKQTIEEAPPLMARAGLLVESSKINVTRTRDNQTTDFNPITVITGSK